MKSLNEQLYLKNLTIDEMDKLGAIEFYEKRYYNQYGYVMRYYAKVKNDDTSWQISEKDYRRKIKKKLFSWL